ncbi:MAG: hypothetical protein SPH90_03555 [Candidatus Alectryocaccobium sp.]|nr:hypothetical protein [Candidatus Alectryocaccobium sp.]
MIRIVNWISWKILYGCELWQKKRVKENYLMHKDIPVCLMELSDDGKLGNYRKNISVIEHFPLGGQLNDMKFHDWWKDRAIPKTRNGAKSALQKLGYE